MAPVGPPAYTDCAGHHPLATSNPSALQPILYSNSCQPPQWTCEGQPVHVPGVMFTGYSHVPTSDTSSAPPSYNDVVAEDREKAIGNTGDG